MPPERVDHAEAIRQYAQRVRSLADAITERAEPMTMRAFSDIEDDTTAIEQHADALADELARVVAYAREMEGYYTSDYSSTTESVEALRARIRAEHGVADLMRDNDEEAR